MDVNRQDSVRGTPVLIWETKWSSSYSPLVRSSGLSVTQRASMAGPRLAVFRGMADDAPMDSARTIWHRLSEPMRLAAIWHVAGFTSSQIADQLGCTSGDVEALLARVRALVRRHTATHVRRPGAD